MDGVVEIPLGDSGLFALVDAADAYLVASDTWHVAWRGGALVYAIRYERKKALLMHRVLMGLEFGDKRYVDHIDGYGLNNRRRNMRLCNGTQNSHNRRLDRDSRTGLKGVCDDGGRGWRAQIKFDGKKIRLGRFSEPTAAAHAYDAAAIAFFGEYARTNRSMGLLASIGAAP